MPKAILEEHGRVAVLRLNNGVTNAIGPQLVDELAQALLKLKDSYQGLVLAGGPQFFCIGFDLPVLLQLDRAGMGAFFEKFNRVAFDLFTLPLPSACAMAGHATAGGNILALTCDFRFATIDKKLIGLNEVKLGLPVPYLADLILRDIVGERAATDMLYRGEFMTMPDAGQIGLIDDLFPPDKVEELTVQRVDELAGWPPAGFALLKANRIESVRTRYEANHQAKFDPFLDCWFSADAQKRLHETAHKF